MSEGYNAFGYVVQVSQEAVIDLCLAGMEAHIVEERRMINQKDKRLETFGLLWGGVSKLADGRTFIDVRKASIDTTAIRSRDSVVPSKTAFLVKKDLMTSFWPEHRFLGDFHTHPYDEAECGVADIERHKLYDFSQGDYDSIIGSKARRRFWSKHGYEVGLVATIVKMKREPRVLADTSRQNRLVFNLGKYRVWLKAYIAFRNDRELQLTSHQDRKVLLYCPWVSGYLGPLTQFGGEDNTRKYVPGQLSVETAR